MDPGHGEHLFERNGRGPAKLAGAQAIRRLSRPGQAMTEGTQQWSTRLGSLTARVAELLVTTN